MDKNNKIYISYAWGENQNDKSDREYLVNQLYTSLLDDGFEVVRDKVDLGYKNSIIDFMQEIGRGKVVIFLSDKYVRSSYCMFELLEIARNSKFSKEEFTAKIFPVFVEFIDFADPDILTTYYDFWEKEEAKWQNLINKQSSSLSLEQFARFDKIKLIRQNIGKLMDWIIDMNTLNPILLSENNFEVIKKALEGNTKTNFNVNQTTGTMADDKQEILNMVISEDFDKVFIALQPYYENMDSTQKTTYHRLKKEYDKNGGSDVQFNGRLNLFLSGLDFEKK